MYYIFGCHKPMITFFDKNRNELPHPSVVIHGNLFSIALLDEEECSKNCVGLFMEDDENLFLIGVFDKTWLSDLVWVASRANKLFNETNHENKSE